MASVERRCCWRSLPPLWLRHRRRRSKRTRTAALAPGADSDRAALFGVHSSLPTGSTGGAQALLTSDRSTLGDAHSPPVLQDLDVLSADTSPGLRSSRKDRVRSSGTPQYTSSHTSNVTGASSTLNTLARPDARAMLVTALEHMAREHPASVFAGRYVLLQERVAGGQAVVNFARGADGGFFQFAIKCD